ncbi:alginate lyase family protein [Halomonas sp. WWR20]
MRLLSALFHGSARLWLWRMVALFSAFSLAVPAYALTYEARQKLDLSQYEVKDTDASYFNVDARLETLANTQNPLLLGQMDKLHIGASCQQLLDIPPLDKRIRMPGFYPSPEAWRLASEPMFQFEDTVSGLAGSFMSTGDIYYGECLIRFLDHWAQNNALMDFYYASDDRQAWYATESMMFAAAMAYSIVRPRVDGMTEEKSRINDWLNRLAHKHSKIVGGLNGSCCNNHFYRRSIYSSMIGVLTNDNELFRFGVSSVYSALNDLTEEGALPLEMHRGRRASHYQNYALLYLITNMQIISRQGYDIFNLEVAGHTIKDAVDFDMAVIADPSQLKDYAPHEQYRGFLEDGQYFAWMEFYLTHFDDPRIEEFIRKYRPIDNRGAGGYVTLYFMDPEAQQQVIITDTVKEKADILLPDAQ